MAAFANKRNCQLPVTFRIPHAGTPPPIFETIHFYTLVAKMGGENQQIRKVKATGYTPKNANNWLFNRDSVLPKT
jgi:hypothetical protein